MKAFVGILVLISAVSAQASQSWVCSCYSDVNQKESLGGIALDIRLSKIRAEQEALLACKEYTLAALTVSCEKFDDGRN